MECLQEYLLVVLKPLVVHTIPLHSLSPCLCRPSPSLTTTIWSWTTLRLLLFLSLWLLFLSLPLCQIHRSQHSLSIPLRQLILILLRLLYLNMDSPPWSKHNHFNPQRCPFLSWMPIHLKTIQWIRWHRQSSLILHRIHIFSMKRNRPSLRILFFEWPVGCHFMFVNLIVAVNCSVLCACWFVLFINKKERLMLDIKIKETNEQKNNTKTFKNQSILMYRWGW